MEVKNRNKSDIPLLIEESKVKAVHKNVKLAKLKKDFPNEIKSDIEIDASQKKSRPLSTDLLKFNTEINNCLISKDEEETMFFLLSRNLERQKISMVKIDEVHF